MSSKWISYTLARIRNDTPKRLVVEAFNPRFKRYLYRPCVLAWLERAEAFLTTYPQVGKEMALRAPELVKRASRELELCEPELELRALTVRGSMLRVLGDLSSAEKAFRRALKLEERLAASPELASTLAACALLTAFRSDHTKALHFVDRALTLLHSSSDPRVGTSDRLSVAGVLVAKGIVLTRSAASLDDTAACFLEALRLSNRNTPLSKRLAASNLGEVLVRGLMEGEPVDVDHLLRWCGSLHRRLAKQAERASSPSRCRLRWVEALALAWRAGGLTQQADAYFASARSSLLKHGATQDVVLLNLDLGYWLCRERQWKRLERIARVTARLAEASGCETEALTALKQWGEALKAKSGELAAFKEVYRVVRGLPAPRLSTSRHTASSRWFSESGW